MYYCQHKPKSKYRGRPGNEEAKTCCVLDRICVHMCVLHIKYVHTLTVSGVLRRWSRGKISGDETWRKKVSYCYLSCHPPQLCDMCSTMQPLFMYILRVPVTLLPWAIIFHPDCLLHTAHCQRATKWVVWWVWSCLVYVAVVHELDTTAVDVISILQLPGCCIALHIEQRSNYIT